MVDRAASIDTSLLARAVIPSQQTATGVAAIEYLLYSDRAILASPALYLEFASLLLKLHNRRTLSGAAIERHFDGLMELPTEPLGLPKPMLRRAWSIARDLGQSDLFDAIGYVIAEVEGGEFWTSDRRFANAAANRGLVGVVFVP